ncbi:MAG: pantoate--beta-alanine ligase [Candidatus Aminicenantes bacterium]|nr:MAG: pantoate--beta-alanine ligase [Candidatus Aminicenantes bacterium]
MKIIAAIKDMRSVVRDLRSQGKTIGLVPTMGCLHEGHLSLIRESVKKADSTVVSIFINPTQFGPAEDFKEYPREMRQDIGILEKEGVDYLFAPEAEEMYPEGYKTYVEVSDFQDRLCGRSRPGHFRGVCTVVLKLFNIVDPDISFFGQKDAQQAIVLEKMVQDLDLEVKIEVLPIIREEDGLALSSRNTYLSPEERKAALVLSKSLNAAQGMIEKGERDSESLIRRMKEILNGEPLAKIDYIEIVDIDNLNPLTKIENKTLIALAVFIKKVRLIDNVIIHIKE